MTKRKIVKLLLVFSVIILSVFISKINMWYLIGDDTYVESYKRDSDYFTHREEMERVSNPQSNRKYFYRYYLECTYTKADFPNVNTKIDTIDTELWYTENHNNHN